MRSMAEYQRPWRQNQRIVANTDELAELVSTAARRLVLIDGVPSAGKTSLAKELARVTTSATLDTDCFLEPGRDTYIDAIDWRALADGLNKALSNEGSRVLLSGACALYVARQLHLDEFLLIYVQRQTEQGLPGDLDDLDAEDATAGSCDTQAPTGLHAEVRNYHAAFRPRHQADIVFLRRATS